MFLNLIKEWVVLGIVIVLDGWKVYVNFGKYGYIYKIVNYFIEFVNKEGFYMNKIEGYWW